MQPRWKIALVVGRVSLGVSVHPRCRLDALCASAGRHPNGRRTIVQIWLRRRPSLRIRCAFFHAHSLNLLAQETMSPATPATRCYLGRGRMSRASQADPPRAPSETRPPLDGVRATSSSVHTPRAPYKLQEADDVLPHQARNRQPHPRCGISRGGQPLSLDPNTCRYIFLALRDDAPHLLFFPAPTIATYHTHTYTPTPHI
ncbi:hypothetical protein C8Q79DRAFT_216824 [Trametes meyenii]|nr:hypothetical protein C8Q79DRAFT_216824 [Trametes meyenii]